MQMPMRKMEIPMKVMQKILINEGVLVKWGHFSHSHFLFERLCCGRIFRYLSINCKSIASISSSCNFFGFIRGKNVRLSKEKTRTN